MNMPARKCSSERMRGSGQPPRCNHLEARKKPEFCRRREQRLLEKREPGPTKAISWWRAYRGRMQNAIRVVLWGRTFWASPKADYLRTSTGFERFALLC